MKYSTKLSGYSFMRMVLIAIKPEKSLSSASILQKVSIQILALYASLC